MTRKGGDSLLSRLIRRRKRARFDPDAPRTRVTTPRWVRPRPSEVVHAERDLSEWVHRQMTTDWDNVVNGRKQRGDRS